MEKKGEVFLHMLDTETVPRHIMKTARHIIVCIEEAFCVSFKCKVDIHTGEEE